jgi:DNA repair photolyase
LTDSEIPDILQQSAANGALYAGYIMLRLPYAVKDLFQEWLAREAPLKANRVLGRIRDVRGGRLSDPRFDSRMTGEGEFAKAMEALFDSTCRKLGLNETRISLTTEHFLRSGQLSMF